MNIDITPKDARKLNLLTKHFGRVDIETYGEGKSAAVSITLADVFDDIYTVGSKNVSARAKNAPESINAIRDQLLNLSKESKLGVGDKVTPDFYVRRPAKVYKRGDWIRVVSTP